MDEQTPGWLDSFCWRERHNLWLGSQPQRAAGGHRRGKSQGAHTHRGSRHPAASTADWRRADSVCRHCWWKGLNYLERSFLVGDVMDGSAWVWEDLTWFHLFSQLYATGYGAGGRLGIGGTESVSTPTLLESIQHVFIKKVAVNSGGKHCLALSSEGEVYSWGEAEDGKLGHGNRRSELHHHHQGQHGWYHGGVKEDQVEVWCFSANWRFFLTVAPVIVLVWSNPWGEWKWWILQLEGRTAPASPPAESSSPGARVVTDDWVTVTARTSLSQSWFVIPLLSFSQDSKCCSPNMNQWTVCLVYPGGCTAGSQGHRCCLRQWGCSDSVFNWWWHGLVLGRRRLRQAGPRRQRWLQSPHEGKAD